MVSVCVCQVCVYEMYVCDCVCNGGCVRGSVYKATRGSGHTVGGLGHTCFCGVPGGFSWSRTRDFLQVQPSQSV